MTQTCKYCKTQNSEQTTFCEGCGRKLKIIKIKEFKENKKPRKKHHHLRNLLFLGLILFIFFIQMEKKQLENEITILKVEDGFNNINNDMIKSSLKGEKAFSKRLKTEKKQLENINQNLDEKLEEKKFSADPPYILVKDRKIVMSFFDPRNEKKLVTWNLPIEAYEKSILEGTTLRQKQNINTLKILNGNYVRINRFKQDDLFVGVVDEFNEGTDEEILKNLWNIMAQLTSYVSDINGEEPRTPFETLIGGGGDCEDSSILYSSLVTSLKKEGWKTQLIYVDSNNLNDPQLVNHVMVKVITPNKPEGYFIQTTVSLKSKDPFERNKITYFYNE